MIDIVCFVFKKKYIVPQNELGQDDIKTNEEENSQNRLEEPSSVQPTDQQSQTPVDNTPKAVKKKKGRRAIYLPLFVEVNQLFYIY